MKKILILIPIVLIILIILLIPKEKTYSDDPKDWLKPSSSEVDIETVTKGLGYDDDTSMKLDISGYETVFTYKGIYKGNFFRDEYIEEGNILMRVTPELRPYNGIIEGVAVETNLDGRLQIYIFLDEDWKKKMPYTYITYGINGSISRPFSFKEISPGVYMDSIQDTKDRFEHNYLSSRYDIYIGDLTTENYFSDQDITAIILT